jgi:hypothetical protein
LLVANWIKRNKRPRSPDEFKPGERSAQRHPPSCFRDKATGASLLQYPKSPLRQFHRRPAQPGGRRQNANPASNVASKLRPSNAPLQAADGFRWAPAKKAYHEHGLPLLAMTSIVVFPTAPFTRRQAAAATCRYSRRNAKHEQNHTLRPNSASGRNSVKTCRVNARSHA